MAIYMDRDRPRRRLIRWNFLVSYFLLVGYWAYKTIHAFLIRNTLHSNFAGYGGPVTFIMYAIAVGFLLLAWRAYQDDTVTARLLAGCVGVMFFVFFNITSALVSQVADPVHVPIVLDYAEASHLLYAFFGAKSSF